MGDNLLPCLPNLSILATSIRDDDAIEIVPRLYLGSLYAAYEKEKLRKLNIRFVVNCSGEDNLYEDSFIYLRIRMKDKENYNILPALLFSREFISKGMQAGSVFVYCSRAKSRSVSVIFGYLMSNCNMSFDDAMILLQKKRPQLAITSAFLLQLRCYFLCRFNIETSNDLYKSYCLSVLLERLYRSKCPDKVMNSYESAIMATGEICIPGESVKYLMLPASINRSYFCCQCHTLLFMGDNAINHAGYSEIPGFLQDRFLKGNMFGDGRMTVDTGKVRCVSVVDEDSDLDFVHSRLFTEDKGSIKGHVKRKSRRELREEEAKRCSELGEKVNTEDLTGLLGTSVLNHIVSSSNDSDIPIEDEELHVGNTEQEYNHISDPSPVEDVDLPSLAYPTINSVSKTMHYSSHSLHASLADIQDTISENSEEICVDDNGHSPIPSHTTSHPIFSISTPSQLSIPSLFTKGEKRGNHMPLISPVHPPASMPSKDLAFLTNSRTLIHDSADDSLDYSVMVNEDHCGGINEADSSPIINSSVSNHAYPATPSAANILYMGEVSSMGEFMIDRPHSLRMGVGSIMGEELSSPAHLIFNPSSSHGSTSTSASTDASDIANRKQLLGKPGSFSTQLPVRRSSSYGLTLLQRKTSSSLSNEGSLFDSLRMGDVSESGDAMDLPISQKPIELAANSTYEETDDDQSISAIFEDLDTTDAPSYGGSLPNPVKDENDGTKLGTIRKSIFDEEDDEDEDDLLQQNTLHSTLKTDHNSWKGLSITFDQSFDQDNEIPIDSSSISYATLDAQLESSQVDAFAMSPVALSPYVSRSISTASTSSNPSSSSSSKLRWGAELKKLSPVSFLFEPSKRHGSVASIASIASIASSSTDDSAQPEMGCSHIFVEPVSWIKEQVLKQGISGLLYCPNPNCGAVLGSFGITNGISCSCKFRPCIHFAIQQSSVEAK